MNIFEWIWLQQSNESTMISYVPSAMPGGNSLDVSSFYKHKYAYGQWDGQCTQFDFREERTGLHHKVQWFLWCIVVPSRLVDMGQHTRPHPAYSWVLGGTVVIFTDCGDHQFVLPRYNISSRHSACILKDILISALLQIVYIQLKLPCVLGVHGLMAAEGVTKWFADRLIFRNGSVDQAESGSYHLENLHRCSMPHVMILVSFKQGAAPSDEPRQILDDVQWWWDPRGFSRRPAWGQAGF